VGVVNPSLTGGLKEHHIEATTQQIMELNKPAYD